MTDKKFFAPIIDLNSIYVLLFLLGKKNAGLTLVKLKQRSLAKHLKKEKCYKQQKQYVKNHRIDLR